MLSKIHRKAVRVGNAYRDRAYFDMAEHSMERQWNYYVWPFIQTCDFTCVVDLAAGYGRNSEFLKKIAKRLLIVDINEECLSECRKRFSGEKHCEFIKTDGYSLHGITDRSVSLVYSFDSMVHFYPEVVERYIEEFSRILSPGGYGFCHHSNFTGNPKGDFRKNPHWRNHMSKEFFAQLCRKNDLEIVKQEIFAWDESISIKYACPDLDCLSMFRKPN